MFHATINGKRTIDVLWDGKNAECKLNDTPFKWDMIKMDDGQLHAIVNDKSYSVELLSMVAETKEMVIKVNGNKYTIQLKDQFDDLLKSLGMENVGLKKLKDVKAPMPGMVLAILVNDGDEVEKDTPLVLLEAMKMENVIKSPAAGKVRKINATKGIAVEKNAVLIEFV